jgi:hypothetical protein
LMSIFIFFFYGCNFRFHIKEWGRPMHYILLLFKISGQNLV